MTTNHAVGEAGVDITVVIYRVLITSHGRRAKSLLNSSKIFVGTSCEMVRGGHIRTGVDESRFQLSETGRRYLMRGGAKLRSALGVREARWSELVTALGSGLCMSM
jgi:hypothetical protein